MPLTRASRKRIAAGEGAESLENASIHVQVPVPKAKRARTAQGKTTITTAATRKTRALKPVATNANATKNSNADSTQQKQPAKGRGRPAKKAKAATTTTKTTRGRKAEASTNDDESSNAAPALAAAEESTSSATLADDKPAGTVTASALSKNRPNAKAATAMTRPQMPASSSFYQNGTPDDIDAWDAHDPLQVTDYVADMYEHFRSKEEQCSVGSMYMGSAAHGKQPHINESMRCILVDWLIEVHYKFKLFPETLYLTVNVLDRFLAQTKETVSKRDLQLVGVTALLVSAKYEEMYVPELRDLTYICDGAYTEAKILRMEEKILKTLNYNVTVPTPHTFLTRFLKAAKADKVMSQLASFLLDGTLLSLENLTCRWRPSQLAAAATLLARRELGRRNWSPTLVSYSLYKEEDVLPVACALLKTKHSLDRNPELKALGKKYSKNKYGKVSHFRFAPLEYPELGSGDESLDGSNL